MFKHLIFFLKVLLASNHMHFVNGNTSKAILKLVFFISNNMLSKLEPES